MTIPPLNKCAKCGTSRHIYLLIDNDAGMGKICKDEKACKAIIDSPPKAHKPTQRP
jgi:hypothetical protein